MKEKDINQFVKDTMGDSVPVTLYVYDMTNGVAAVMSQMLLGRHIEGIWHTAVVVYGREFFFGGSGIQSCLPVSTVCVCLLTKRHIFYQFYKIRFSLRAHKYIYIAAVLHTHTLPIIDACCREFACKKRNVNISFTLLVC